jgi:hypothetical protein
MSLATKPPSKCAVIDKDTPILGKVIHLHGAHANGELYVAYLFIPYSDEGKDDWDDNLVGYLAITLRFPGYMGPWGKPEPIATVVATGNLSQRSFEGHHLIPGAIGTIE